MDDGCKASQRLPIAVTLVLQSLCLEQSRQICTGIKLLDISVSCKSSDLSATWPGHQRLNDISQEFPVVQKGCGETEFPVLFATP